MYSALYLDNCICNAKQSYMYMYIQTYCPRLSTAHVLMQSYMYVHVEELKCFEYNPERPDVHVCKLYSLDMK